MGKNIEGKFNVGVGAAIENKEGKILLLRRSKNVDIDKGIWHIITGRVKQFEDPEDTLRREVKEEAGIEVEIIKPIIITHFFGGEKTVDNELIMLTYWCKAKSENIILSHENDDYRWISPEEALKMVKYKQYIEAFLKERNY